MLCGESGGLRPLDFDYGNSPAECAALDLRARQVVLSTSNGTRALLAASGAAAIYVGAPPNATAVTAAAIARCRRDDLGLTIICAGRDYGRLVSLEDAFCAGLLVERVWRIAGEHFVPDDGAVAAFRLFHSYEDEPAAAVFAESWNGQRLREWGLPADLDYCGAVDATTIVPVVRIDAGGLWVVADERR
ncbi:MAG: 2-phosphosulfolactate phosphatase [Chloroflexi bacterium]|nr:2-phosphosulfolactate phosphatase [Chloroflexota bacterium]